MADNSLSRSQQLLADMDAKYGKTSSSAPVEPVAPPPVQPAPQPAAKKPGGMLEGAMNLIGNRNKQIDKAAGYSLGGKVGKRSFQYGGSTDGAVLEDDGAMAAGLGLIDQGRQQQAMAQQDLANKFAEIDGYACGGKPKPRAAAGAKVDASGKISGPGTATSDSIPAKVSPTGEDILVANGERIISVEQDQLLERIAQMLGFDTVDAMFEQMTGKPVGPSMKNGMMAAADGASIYDPTYEALKEIPGAVLPNTSAVYNEAGKDVGDAMSKGNYGNAFGLATRGMLATGAGLVDDVVGGAYRGAKQMLSPVVSGVLGNVDQASPSAQQGQQGITTPAATQAMKPGSGAPAQSPTPVQPVQRGRDANGVITAESAKAFQDSGGLAGMKSGSFYGTADLAGQNDRMAKSLGYASADDFNKQFKERADTVRGGVGVVGDVGGGLTQTDLDNAEKSRRWMVEDELGKGGRSGPAADASMINNLLAANTAIAGARLRGDQQMQQPQTVRQQSVDPLDTRKKQIEVAGMEEMAGLRGKALAGDPKAVAMINALSGKNSDKDRYHNLPNRKVYNEMGQVIDEVPGGLFDTQTGQMVQSGATQKPKQFTAGQTYTDANGNKAIYQKDGTWKEVK